MKPWIRRTLVAVGTLCVVLMAAYYWLIVESHMPSSAQYDLDIAEVRRLAASLPGDLPSGIEEERVAEFRFPSTAVVAGDGWKSTELPVYSYRIAYPHSSIIVDTALAQETGGSNLAGFDPDAYSRMQTAMAKASAIVITHEHMDHIGGLTNAAQLPALLPNVRLTREQLSQPEVALPAQFPNHALDGYVPLQYGKYLALAPGVVLIRAAGHTAGSQMVFVVTAAGKEFLLIGDIAWHYRNIETGRERARLMTWLILKEDRAAVFGELKALRQLHESNPAIRIIPGHDGAVIDALVADGSVKSKFSAPTVEQ
jgi:glyoxylase-like metal-dependent hydrolase (beta-lactamase superfamily II)